MNTCPISVTLRAEVEAMRKEFTYRRFENVNKGMGSKRKKWYRKIKTTSSMCRRKC